MKSVFNLIEKQFMDQTFFQALFSMWQSQSNALVVNILHLPRSGQASDNVISFRRKNWNFFWKLLAFSHIMYSHSNYGKNIDKKCHRFFKQVERIFISCKEKSTMHYLKAKIVNQMKLHLENIFIASNNWYELIRCVIYIYKSLFKFNWKYNERIFQE